MADPTMSPPNQSQLNVAASTTQRRQHHLNLESLAPSPSSSEHVNRLINSNHYISPSRPIYSDRFIPCRSSSNFALFNISLPSPSATAGSSPGDGGKEDNPNAYAALLRNALFGPQTPDKKDWGTGAAGRNIFRYKTETRQSMHSLSPFGFDGLSGPGVSNVAIKAPRKVSRSPYKVGVIVNCCRILSFLRFDEIWVLLRSFYWLIMRFFFFAFFVGIGCPCIAWWFLFEFGGLVVA